MFILATNRPRPIKRFRMNVGGEKFFIISTDPHITRGLVDLSQGKPSLADIFMVKLDMVLENLDSIGHGIGTLSLTH